MKKFLFATAMVASLGSVLPASAAEPGVNAGASIGAAAGVNVPGGSVAGTVGGTKDTERAAAAIAARSHGEIRKIKTLASISSVKLIDVSKLAGGSAEASLNDALARNGKTVRRFQAALSGNANVMSAIKAENPNFNVSSVVAARIRTNGALVVYTRG